MSRASGVPDTSQSSAIFNGINYVPHLPLIYHIINTALKQDPNNNSMLDMLIGYSCIQSRILLLLLLSNTICFQHFFVFFSLNYLVIPLQVMVGMSIVNHLPKRHCKREHVTFSCVLNGISLIWNRYDLWSCPTKSPSP